MKLLTSALLLSVGALAHSGWTIPRDHPRGVYNVAVDASGNSEHVLVRDLSASTKSALSNSLTNAAGLSKRDLSKREDKPENTGIHRLHCFDYPLNATDGSTAVDGLKSQCGKGGFLKKGTDYYVIAGDLVAYVCNFSDGPNICTGDEVKDALENKVSVVCGSFIAGYDHVQPRGLRFGYEKRDAKFCDGRGIKGDDD
ncbi:hypothetical protein MMC31_005619 [Peltigera leucophlebia]|nr:hypothetical protein [Peltigera leucophlebia]